jgi:enamine deaminase RidA (YjgF/YER057c/UK114 family)
MSTSRRIFNPSTVHPPVPTYSHISIVSLSSTARLITIAGQVGKTETGETPPDFIDQINLALANVGKCLEAANAKVTDIVRVVQYVVKLLPQDPRRGQAYVRFFGDHTPPSTLVGVEALAEKELLYEIEVTAVTTD